MNTSTFSLLLACLVGLALAHHELRPEYEPAQVEEVEPSSQLAVIIPVDEHHRNKRSALLGIGVLGAGALGAGLLGAGVLGAGILGAKALGAGFVGGAIASKALHGGRSYGGGYGGYGGGYGGYGGYAVPIVYSSGGYGGYNGGYRGGYYGSPYRREYVDYAPTYYIEESYC